MTRIRMMETITGGRYDGRPWPAANEVIHVPEWEAVELVSAKHAVYEEDPVLAEEPASPEPAAPGASAGDPGAAADAAAVAQGEPEAAPEPSPGDAGPSVSDAGRPAVNQPKAAWVAWAVSQGADPVAAEAMTKADLMSEYGPRL